MVFRKGLISEIEIVIDCQRKLGSGLWLWVGAEVVEVVHPAVVARATTSHEIQTNRASKPAAYGLKYSYVHIFSPKLARRSTKDTHTHAHTYTNTRTK